MPGGGHLEDPAAAEEAGVVVVPSLTRLAEDVLQAAVR
jgi:hypothetical protein